MTLKHANGSKWNMLIGTVLCFVVLGLNQWVHAQEIQPQDNKTLPLEDVQRFSTAISQIKNFYVKPVKDSDLFEDAIRGMLVGLDPHSAYLDESEFQDLHVSTKGKFGGLGIEVTMTKGLIKVISPIDDTPAFKAGIKAGDYIIRIDSKPIKDMTLREAVDLMRGKVGSKIKLTIIRKNVVKPIVVNITRAIIQIKSVKSRVIDDYYGYIRISHFQGPTSDDVVKAVAKLKKETKGKLKGLIIDLRNNPGGLLDSAIEVSDAFIDNASKSKDKKIVFTKGRLPGSEFTAIANPGDILKNKPIIVLINEGSASGSEIVAGALKDNHRAIIVGQKSFGKGSVQTILPLSGNRGIKLTTALYYTPSGKSIQAEGITPDILIKALNIPEDKAEKTLYDRISEADLKGHLANGNDKDKKKATRAPDTNPDKKLVHTDYQLYEAVNLLKGLVFFNNKS